MKRFSFVTNLQFDQSEKQKASKDEPKSDALKNGSQSGLLVNKMHSDRDHELRALPDHRSLVIN